MPNDPSAHFHPTPGAHDDDEPGADPVRTDQPDATSGAQLPDIDPPIVSVTTIYPGANAAVVETEVSERLEEAINNIEGIKTLTSQSREQVSNITIEFDLSREIDLAAQDVRDRVSRVRDRLPESIREPIIAKQDADARPIIWIGMFSDRYSPL